MIRMELTITEDAETGAIRLDMHQPATACTQQENEFADDLEGYIKAFRNGRILFSTKGNETNAKSN